MDENLFNELDQIANMDLRGRKNRYLYQAARGPDPISLESAEIIESSVGKNNSVILSSGFPIIPKNQPETDGPPSTIILAKTLEELGVTPVFAVGNLCVGIHQKLAELVNLEDYAIEIVPRKQEKAEKKCYSLLEKYTPELLISVEKPGKTKDGRYKNMRGNDVTSLVGKIDYLFLKAHETDIPSIGVGDGGNEIGMGNIKTAVAKHIPHGETIASEIRVDSLMVSSISNWGVYSIIAALSILKKKQFLHDPIMEKRMIKGCLEEGAIDGVTKKSEYSVDGIPGYIHENMVEIFRFMVENNI